MLDWMVDRLKQENPERIIRYGFAYTTKRDGFCNHVLLQPKRNVRVRTLIKVLMREREESSDKGDFSIDCWLIYNGRQGEEITTYMFEEMLSGSCTCTCFAKCRLDYERGTHGLFPESHKPEYVFPEESLGIRVKDTKKV